MLYDNPTHYEAAFSFRDIPSEVDFLQAAVKRFSYRPVANVLEIACGPAPHAAELTGRGYRYAGIDINRNMLDYAARKWSHLDPSPDLLEADMVDFALPSPADFAFVMIGSLYLSSRRDLDRHFDCVSRSLAAGGLYFLDWCIQFQDPLQLNDRNRYCVEADGIEVQSRFKIREIDHSERVFEEVWTFDVNDHGTASHYRMAETNKAIFPDEFRDFVAGRPDFEFVGWWQDWDFSAPIRAGQTVRRPLAIVRRTERSTPPSPAPKA